MLRKEETSQIKQQIWVCSVSLKLEYVSIYGFRTKLSCRMNSKNKTFTIQVYQIWII